MNFLGMGPMELLLIIVLALIVFGPAKLPEIMGQVGKAINDFRRATSELSDEFNKTIQAELQEGRSALEETRTAVSDVHTTVNSAIAGTPAPTRVAAPGEPTVMANGTAPEPYVDGYPETRISNGTVSEPTKPALADTTAWSWETSPSKPAQPSDAERTPIDPTSTNSSPSAESAGSLSPSPSPVVPEPIKPVGAESESAAAAADPSANSHPSAPHEAPSSARERGARDELLPPY